MCSKILFFLFFFAFFIFFGFWIISLLKFDEWFWKSFPGEWFKNQAKEKKQENILHNSWEK